MAGSREPRRGTEIRQFIGRRGRFRRQLRMYGEGEKDTDERKRSW